MTRTTLLALALAALACENQRPPGRVAGPPYTPATADALKAYAPDCELQPAPGGGEIRACHGRQVKTRIELDRERRLRELEISVLASTGVPEAWVLLDNVLSPVVGQPVRDAAHARLRGDAAGDVVDGVRVAAAIDGQRHTVKLTWGR